VTESLSAKRKSLHSPGLERAPLAPRHFLAVAAFILALAFTALAPPPAAAFEFKTSVTDQAGQDTVTSFVTRFYVQCLNRQPDPGGLDHYVTRLNNGYYTGGDVARAFIFCPEFEGRQTSNPEFLTILYMAFFNRKPDEMGYRGWLAALEAETSRWDVTSSFIGSQEFAALCSEYGISPYPDHQGQPGVDAPNPVKPANGAEIVFPAGFQWDPLPGASQYHLQVHTYTASATGRTEMTDSNTEQTVTDPMIPAGRRSAYGKWRVSADDGPYCPWQDFTVGR